MRRMVSGACTLLLVAFAATTARGQQAVADDAASTATQDVTLVGFDAYGDACGCELDGCGCDVGGCCTDCGGSARSCGAQFFGGADYIYARANFSEALAFVSTRLGPPVTTTHEQLDFDYQSSVRYFVGYRLSCCGDEIRFTGTHFDSDATASQEVGAVVFETPFSNLDGSTFTGGGIPGTVATVSANAGMDFWDLTFARSLCVGGPTNSCCGECCGCCCPTWELKWSGGVRIADGGWSRTGAAVVPPTPLLVSAAERQDFQGAGLMLGLEGQRYFGPGNMFSGYIKGNVAALLGDVNYSRETFGVVPVGAAPPVNVRDQMSTTRIVPVTEIEVGGTVALTSNLTVSGGYFFQAWHDLGMSPEVEVNGAAGDLRFDDANILGFDGMFVRLEASF